MLSSESPVDAILWLHDCKRNHHAAMAVRCKSIGEGVKGLASFYSQERRPSEAMLYLCLILASHSRPSSTAALSLLRRSRIWKARSYSPTPSIVSTSAVPFFAHTQMYISVHFSFFHFTRILENTFASALLSSSRV